MTRLERQLPSGNCQYVVVGSPSEFARLRVLMTSALNKLAPEQLMELQALVKEYPREKNASEQERRDAYDTPPC